MQSVIRIIRLNLSISEAMIKQKKKKKKKISAGGKGARKKWLKARCKSVSVMQKSVISRMGNATHITPGFLDDRRARIENVRC